MVLQFPGPFSRKGGGQIIALLSHRWGPSYAIFWEDKDRFVSKFINIVAQGPTTMLDFKNYKLN